MAFPVPRVDSIAGQTEADFAEIAAAGLNFVRIPIAYWAIEVRENEPFLAKTSWTCVTTIPTHGVVVLTLSHTQVFPEGYPVGAQVRSPYQPRLALSAGFAEWLEPLRPSRRH